MRLAYADPPYPGKANRYPECQEVDHEALIASLCEYDGWALSTDEINLRDVLALCPPRTRILAWARSNAPPFYPYPYSSWEPVLCVPARTKRHVVTAHFVSPAPVLGMQRDGLTGQKTAAFCEWVLRAMGADAEDELTDVFPGTGVMSQTFERFRTQPELPPGGEPVHAKSRANRLRRVATPLPGFDRAPVLRERAIFSGPAV